MSAYRRGSFPLANVYFLSCFQDCLKKWIWIQIAQVYQRIQVLFRISKEDIEYR